MTEEETPDVFTADYIGQPGQRTFYIQARWTARMLSFLVEKQQVSVLAEKLKEMLIVLDREDTISTSLPERDPALSLQEPVEAEWRVGAMGLAYEEEPDRVLVVLQPVESEDDEPEDVIEETGEGYRFALRRDQVRTFVLHVEAVVGEGRPLCQLCGLPIDPEGHICPASNGHRPTM
jgi:uncharacterized repeat protein (TIGR03847 family)